MNTCGHSVTARLKKYAAFVPMETSVDMLAVRWRRSRRNPAWNSKPTQNWTGVANAQRSQGLRSQAGAQRKPSTMLPMTMGTDRIAPTTNFERARRCVSSRADCSRSGVWPAASRGSTSS